MEPQEYHTLRAVEDTHWWFRSLHEHVLHCLREVLIKPHVMSSSPEPRRGAYRDICHPKPLKIFEAGCGTGGLALKLQALVEDPERSRGGVVEGVDLSPLAIEECRKRGLTGMRVADLNTLKLPENTYDAIVSIDVLYHRDIEDPPRVLRLFQKALKPSGTLFLHLPAYEMLRSDHDQRVHTGRRFRLWQVKRMLSDADFTVEHGSYRLAFLFLPALILRFTQRLFAPVTLKRNTEERSALERGRRGHLVLLALCRLENAVSRWLPLPFGVSLYVLARKPIPGLLEPVQSHSL